MAKVQVQYKSKVSLKWIHGKEITEIETSYISNVIIDRNYDNSNMPILYMILNLPTTLYNKMIAGQKKDKVLLNIEHYNVLEENPRTIEDIKGKFYYFLPTNTDANDELATQEKEQTGVETAYSRVTMGLVLPRVINDNRRVLESNIYRDINKATLVYLSLTHVQKLCINNIVDKNISEIMMPSVSSVNDYLKYIDDKYGIYNLGYRYFHDFDITYLLNESGAYIPNGNKEHKLVSININSNIADDSVSLGMYIMDESYQVDVSASDAIMNIDKNTTVAVSRIAVIDDVDGKIGDAELDDGSKVEYIRDDRKSTNRIVYNAKKYDVTVDVTKPYLDDELFTPNKIYKVKNYEKYKDQDGRYILYRKQTIYQNKDGEFVPTTVLSLRKKVEL